MKRLSVIILVCIIFVTAVAQWPLAWTPLGSAIQKIERPDSKTRAVLSGTLWNGDVRGLYPVGEVQYSFSLIRLIQGASPLNFTTSSRAILSRGSGGLNGLKDVKASGDLAWILPEDQRFGGVQGLFNMSLDTLFFDFGNFEAGCTEAQGQFSTNVLQSNAAIWQWSGPELSGPIQCENGELTTRLKGQDRTQNIEVKVVMKPDGIYVADITVQTQEPGASAILGLFGFAFSGSDYTLQETGKWR